MWNFLLQALPFIGKSVLPRIAQDKDKVEDNRHEETTAFEARVSAENASSINRVTWWDSFVDGLNRLVRPVFTFGTAGIFVWAVIDPIKFTASMAALALVPEPLWIIMGTIVAFWFGQRMVEGIKAPSIDPSKVAHVVSQIKQIESLHESVVTEETYHAAMNDTSKPLPNAVIMEWNRRRHVK